MRVDAEPDPWGLEDEVRGEAMLYELQRILRLIYGDDWREVYDDLILWHHPEEYLDA